MGWLKRIRNWIMERLDTNRIEKDFNVKITSDMDMQDLIEDWLEIYQGRPDWVGTDENQIPQKSKLSSKMLAPVLNILSGPKATVTYCLSSISSSD